MFRIGAATLHSAEKVGFHAPGMTGPFGSAAACASLMQLSAAQTANAFGIAGSLAGGLLAFAKSGSGGMIKRLHLGRAAEGGVIAARLAQRGYEGPPTVLEGRYGVLEAFCEETDPSLLTKGLGRDLGDRAALHQALCLPRHRACAGAAAARLHRAARLLPATTSPRSRSTHPTRSCRTTASTDPGDIMLAQYSVPFNLAIAAYHDPRDPGVFNDETDRPNRACAILRSACACSADGGRKGWSARSHRDAARRPALRGRRRTRSSAARRRR